MQERREIRRRAADGDDRAALLDEFFDARQCALDRHAADLPLILGRQVGDRAVCTGAATTAPACTRAGNRSVDEDEDVVLLIEVACVERGREHTLERELELLENPPRPTGRN